MEKIFTLELDKNDLDSIELHLNKKGAELLKSVLDRLILANDNDHLHLMSADWGGNELSSDLQSQNPDIQLIHHVRIMYWKE